MAKRALVDVLQTYLIHRDVLVMRFVNAMLLHPEQRETSWVRWLQEKPLGMPIPRELQQMILECWRQNVS